jgi:hypothetical protein
VVYCWTCGTEVPSDPDAFVLHFQWWNLLGCPQLRDSSKRPHWDIVWRVLWALLVASPCFASAAVLGVLTCGFLPCNARGETVAFFLFVDLFSYGFVLPVGMVFYVLIIILDTLLWSLSSCIALGCRMFS